MIMTDEVCAKRARQLLKKMTPAEKAGQLTYIGVLGENTNRLIREGSIGVIANIKGGANEINGYQKLAVENTRLGIPLLVGNDVIHGYKTIFPSPLAESCSWDAELAARTSAAAAAEAAADGTRWIFAPMLDVSRDPRWGRIYESSGEDSFLTGKLGSGRIAGIRGVGAGRPDGRVISCAKHFAAYGACEGGRDYNTADLSESVLRNIYLPPFKACVDAGVESVMVSFNEVNGVPSTANKHLILDILRGEWGFDGIVVNDYFALLELIIHGLADSPEDACRLSFNAGVEVDMNSGIYLNYLNKLVKKGIITEESIDSAVYRMLYFKYWLGLFDAPYIDISNSKAVLNDTGKRVELARESARKSVVLLKNEGALLPLSKEIKTLAVIGPLANDADAPLGWWRCNGECENTVTVLEGIKSKLPATANVLYEKGCDITGGSDEGFKRALEIAKKADAVVFVAGESAQMSGEAKSRASVMLPGRQEELLRAVHAAGVPVVLVLNSGRPLSVPWAAENVPAILAAWLLGHQSGNAIADILFGDFNPEGKLSSSIPRATQQIPVYYNHKNTGRPDGFSPVYCLSALEKTYPEDNGIGEYLNMMIRDFSPSANASFNDYTTGYKDLPVTPLYPFGHGLSYTRFEYSDLKTDKKVLKKGQALNVSVRVKNAGKTAGRETVQLYIRDLAGSITRPVKELKGFCKVGLNAGEEKEVGFVLDEQALGFWNNEGKFIVEAGRFQVFAGTNSEELLSTVFDLII